MALPKLPRFRFRSIAFDRHLRTHLIPLRGLVRRCARLMVIATLLLVGCSDDTDLVREIQGKRQAKQQLNSQTDHLGEAFNLLRQYIDLDADKAERQVAYHLNRWGESKKPSNAAPPELIKSIRELVEPEQLNFRVADLTFQPSDAKHLRNCYVFRSIYNWVDYERHDERLLTEWLKTQEKELGIEETEDLRTATRLFDWTVRNIAYEPDKPLAPAPPGPQFPLGMEFQGPGYRQTDYQTVMRGTGDGLQRAGVFTQLCAQAGIPAAILGPIDGTTGEVEPFCVGVLVGKEVYLFEPRLGIFVPGPNQVGIATLSQARRDAVVLRRLGISGLDQFTYPVKKEDVQQCAALLNLLPESISPRMQQLQSGLTGDRRMNVYVDADAMAKKFDAVTGISSVRLWDVPLLAEVYRFTCTEQTLRDPIFNSWYYSRWAMMDEKYGMARDLSRARWKHLTGEFNDSEEEGTPGARTLYLTQRNPEFEIEDLRIDVELQAKYGIRRSDLDVDGQEFDQQIAAIQAMMRLGKRTATYWLSLLQADDDRTETAASWIQKRVLDEEQQSMWIPSARYNLARLKEALGETEPAIEMYKREGEPQEHGNRIRARLLEYQTKK